MMASDEVIIRLAELSIQTVTSAIKSIHEYKRQELAKCFHGGVQAVREERRLAKHHAALVRSGSLPRRPLLTPVHLTLTFQPKNN